MDKTPYPLTSLNEIERIYQKYFKKNFDHIGFEQYETTLDGDCIKFKCDSFLLQFLDDRLIETDISPLYGPEHFRSIESYSALLTLMDAPQNLNKSEVRKIIGTRLGFEDQSKFILENYIRLGDLLDKKHYKVTLKGIEKIKTELI